MKLLYQGTAAAEAIPALFCECPACKTARALGRRGRRTRSGALVDGVIKLDFGPDSYTQMTENNLDYSHLHTVFITHSHEDHLAEKEFGQRSDVCSHIYSDDILLTVYGNEAVGAALKRYESKYTHFERIKPFETVSVQGYAVTALEAVHCVSASYTAWPMVFEGETVHRSEETLFYLIEKDGKRLLYAHDTDEFSAADMEFLKGKRMDLVSLDCTNGVLELNYIGHMGAKDNLRMREKLLSIGAADEKTVFVANHFSHNGFTDEETIQALLPGFVISHDGLEIEF